MAVIRSAPGESVTSRALSLLDAFDAWHPRLTLSQISRRAGVPVSTAHRRLRDLVDGRLLALHPDGTYEIGPRMWHLGLLSRPTTMREAALPHIQDLVAGTHHTAHVGVLDGLGVLVVDRIGGSRTVPTRHSPGGRLPLYCTAIGKALLAFAPDQVQEQAARAMVPHTPFTNTDPRILRRQLVEIQRTQVAFSEQEHRMGVASVAVPILVRANLVAAVAVLAPYPSRLGASVEAVRMCAAAVARSIDEHERRHHDSLGDA